MTMQLDFSEIRHYDPGDPGITLEIKLSVGKQTVQIDAKLDTGAAHSIFERRFGEQLGFTIEDGLEQRFTTATGTFTAWGHESTVDIAGIAFNATVFFADNLAFSRNVIGRFGGLDQLRVGIIDYDGELYLARYES